MSNKYIYIKINFHLIVYALLFPQINTHFLHVVHTGGLSTTEQAACIITI